MNVYSVTSHVLTVNISHRKFLREREYTSWLSLGKSHDVYHAVNSEAPCFNHGSSGYISSPENNVARTSIKKQDKNDVFLKLLFVNV